MRSARPTIEPGLRPADQLVAAERDQVGAGGEALGRRRLVGEAERRGLEQRPAPEVVDDDRAVLVGEPGELDRVAAPRRTRSARSSTGWTRRTTVARPSASGASKSAARVRFVVPTSMRRAPGSSDDLRDADATADLDQLAARDGDAVLAGQPDREREGRGVVDGDERVLGAGQRDQVVLRGTEPGAATPGVAVELEQRIARRRHASAASMATAGHGARPRLVWRITPVALRTVVRPLSAGSAKPSSRSRTASARSSSGVGRLARPRGAPARRPRRPRATAQRPPVGRSRRQLRADGGKQPFDARGTRTIGRHWPSVAGTRGSRTHRAAPSAAPLVLKTRGPTGTRPLPSRW